MLEKNSVPVIIQESNTMPGIAFTEKEPIPEFRDRAQGYQMTGGRGLTSAKSTAIRTRT